MSMKSQCCTELDPELLSSCHFHIVSCWLAQGGYVTGLKSHSNMQSIGFKLRVAQIQSLFESLLYPIG